MHASANLERQPTRSNTAPMFRGLSNNRFQSLIASLLRSLILTPLSHRTPRHQSAARTTPYGPGCQLTASAYARC